MIIRDDGQLIEFTGDVFCWNCDEEHYDISMVEDAGTRFFKCPVDKSSQSYNPRDWDFQ